jgi:hypothetical protein
MTPGRIAAVSGFVALGLEVLWTRSFSPRFPVYILIGHTDPAALDVDGFQTRIGKLADTGKLPPDVWLRRDRPA